MSVMPCGLRMIMGPMGPAPDRRMPARGLSTGLSLPAGIWPRATLLGARSWMPLSGPRNPAARDWGLLPLLCSAGTTDRASFCAGSIMPRTVAGLAFLSLTADLPRSSLKAGCERSSHGPPWRVPRCCSVRLSSWC